MVRITVQEALNGPETKMQSAIQLAGFHIITCSKARISQQNASLKIDKQEYTFGNIKVAPTHLLQDEYLRWAFSSTLRDLIEAFSILLLECYVCAYKVRELIENPLPVSVDKFEMMGVDGQLSVLDEQFGIGKAWLDRLAGYNAARNCMAHRMGRVALKDADPDSGKLTVRWLSCNVEVSDKPSFASPMGDLLKLIRMSGTQEVAFALLDAQKSFEIGHIVHFSLEEMLQICGTFSLFTTAIMSMAISACVTSDGRQVYVHFDDPSERP